MRHDHTIDNFALVYFPLNLLREQDLYHQSMNFHVLFIKSHNILYYGTVEVSRCCLMFRLTECGFYRFFGGPHLRHEAVYPISNYPSPYCGVSVGHCKYCNSCNIILLKFLFLLLLRSKGPFVYYEEPIVFEPERKIFETN